MPDERISVVEIHITIDDFEFVNFHMPFYAYRAPSYMRQCIDALDDVWFGYLKRGNEAYVARYPLSIYWRERDVSVETESSRLRPSGEPDERQDS